MEFASKDKITGGGQDRNSGGQHHQIMQLRQLEDENAKSKDWFLLVESINFILHQYRCENAKNDSVYNG